MHKMNVKQYRIELTPITPVHIGTGEPLNPTNYVILKEKNTDSTFYMLYKINIPALYDLLNPKEKENLLTLLDNNNLSALWRTLKELSEKYKSNYKAFINYGIVEDNVYQEYNEQISKTTPSSKLEIWPTIRDSSAIPYIPGSSLKGAIRTAYLNAKYPAKEQDLLKLWNENITNVKGFIQRQAERKVESIILGNYSINKKRFVKPDIFSDPFKSLQISDLKPTPNSDPTTTVAKCHIKHIQKSEMVSTFTDVILPAWIFEDDLDCTFTTNVLIKQHFQESCRRSHKTIELFDINDIFKTLREFYIPRLEQEIDKYYRAKKWASEDCITKLINNINSLAGNEAIIRIGRHSHFESMTISSIQTKLRQKAPNNKKQLQHGRTRAFADVNGSLLPLGWCKIKLEQI